MSELSDILRLKREELKKSIKMVSKDTKIREQYILMIENARYDSLPSYLHAYGFVKQYAEYLGLDYLTLVKPLFDEECPKVKAIPVTVAIEPIDNNHIYTHITNRRNIFIGVGVAVVLLIVVFIALYSTIFAPTEYKSNSIVNSTINLPETTMNNLLNVATDNTSTDVMVDNTTSTTKQSPNQIVKNTIDITTTPPAITEINDKKIADARKQREVFAAEASAIAEKAKADAVAIDNSPKRLLLTFSGDCWVQYTADNLPAVEYSGSAGQSKAVTFIDNFTIDIGNAAAISFSYSRQKFEHFGAEGVVMKNLRYKLVDGVLVREQR